MIQALYERLPGFAQDLALSLAGRARARARFTPHFHRCLNEWEKTGAGPRDGLLALQRARLDALVRMARRHVPHYRAFDLPEPSRAADPERALAETLAGIPVLEKEAYRSSPESFLSEQVPPKRRIAGKTSGTTGTPLPLWYTSEALAEEYATVWRMRRGFGVERIDPHLSFGGQLIVPFRRSSPPFWRTNRTQGQTLFSLYHMTQANLPHYVEAMQRTPARYVQGYPSAIFLVARAMLDAGRPLPAGRLAAVFTSSESLLAFQRESIEAAFSAPVRDRYGTSEFAVSMTACREDRLHVDMEFGLVEVEVQEETREWVRGPLLVTGFANEATPLLRYRIGDVGTRLVGPCACGRAGDVFLDVDGRIEDYVVTPDGRMVGRLDHIFKASAGVAEAQILQETPEAVEMLVVRAADWDDDCRQGLLKSIRERLGGEIGVQLRLVDQIPREANGKFRAVKSQVGAVGRSAP